MAIMELCEKLDEATREAQILSGAIEIIQFLADEMRTKDMNNLLCVLDQYAKTVAAKMLDIETMANKLESEAKA